MKFRGMSLSVLALTLALMFALAPAAPAQLLQGSLDGNVVDSSQAAIPGATVTITNEQTGTVRTTESSAIGQYSFPTIASGLWTLEVKSEGFQAYRQTGVDVRPNAVARVNVVLEIGAVTETIEVSATAATLQTDRAEVRQEVNEKTLKNVPVPLGRNYQMLFLTLPGFSPPANAHSVPTNPSRAVSFSVNGTSRSNNNTRIDGASSTNIWVPHMTGYNPALESIEQVNVVTSSFDAEQGLAGGAAINLTIKSGTNDVHGSAFEYHTSQSMMANPWRVNQEQKPKFIYNQFGGTVGGPIVKNRAFFFVSYEGTRESQFAQRFVDVADAQMRTGDYSGVLRDDRCAIGGTGSADCQVYDPMSGASNGENRTAFPNYQIPQSRFDPGVNKILTEGFGGDQYPLPNRPGTGVFGLNQNYLGGGSTTFFRDTIDSKVNFNHTDKLTSFVRFSMLDYRMRNDQIFGNLGGNRLHPTNSNPGDGFGNSYSGTLSATYVANPNLVFDAYFGYTFVDTNVEQDNLDQNVGWDFLGIPGLQSDRKIDGGWPRMRIDGFEQLGITNQFMPYYRSDPQWQYVANGNWTKGSHNVRFGTDIYYQSLNHNQPEFSGSQGGASGGFRFRTGTTRLNNTGGVADSRSTDYNGWGSFLLGSVQDAGKIWQFNPDGYKTRTELWSFYVRDRWQINPKLTMSYGVRYEIYPFPTRKERGLERFIMDDTSGLAGGVGPNDMVICGAGNQPRDCGIDVGKQMFVPRLGLAYRATDNMVLRAGYGITVDPFNWARPLRTNYPIMEVFNINESGFTEGTTLRQGLPVITEPDISSGVLPLPREAAVRFFDNNNAVRGYIQSWNASLEKRFQGNWIGTVSYVATRSVNQLANLEQNWSPIGTGNGGRLLNNPTFNNRRVSTDLFGSLGTPKYDALQSKLEHRFSSGFQMNFAYTWSHTRAYTDEDSGDGTRRFGIPEFYDRGYGRANQDIRHNFQWTGIYESPFGKGKKWLNQGPAAAILGGWQFNNLLSLYTGTPFTVTAPGGDLNSQGLSQVADCIGEPNKLGNFRDQSPMYDTSTFQDPNEVFGDTPRLGTCGINILSGAGLFNMDIGLFRKFQVTEKVDIQFRAEGFNITNTPKLNNPNSDVSSGNFMLITSQRNTGREGIRQRFFRFGLRIGW